MAVTDEIVEKCRALPPDKQWEVIAFIDFLAEKAKRGKPYPSLRGLWADQGFDIAEEDIKQARQEMWGNFPREDI